MAFTKTSIAYSAPKRVDNYETHTSVSYEIGEKKDGKVWDGEKWVTQADWENSQRGSEKNG